MASATRPTVLLQQPSNHMAQRIRFAAETDATQILDIYAPIVRDTAISFEEVPPNRPEMAGRIRSTLNSAPDG